MKLEKIKKKYQGEWVLIEYKKLDDNLVPLDGEVLVHSSSKDEIYKKQLSYKNRQLAIEYFGEVPEDWAVML